MAGAVRAVRDGRDNGEGERRATASARAWTRLLFPDNARDRSSLLIFALLRRELLVRIGIVICIG